MDATRSNKLSLDPSLLGTLHRRTHFFVQYIHAKVRPKAVAKLLPIVEKTFEHPWVVEVELRIQFLPGLEGAWLWQSNPQRSMHWDAPITLSVIRKKRGKKRVAFCFSVFLIGNTLSIKQIQGVSGTDIPSELRAWPKIFMEACRTFACQENLKEVRVARASSLYSYHRPWLDPQLLPDSRERALERIRRNMELLYDTNALDLGFTADGDWFRWTNPMSLRQFKAAKPVHGMREQEAGQAGQPEIAGRS